MSNTIPTELKEAYETAISYMFHEMPVSEMDIGSVIAEGTVMYGTTADEHIFGIDDFKRILNMQAEEMEGLEPHFERIPVFQHLSDNGTTGLFVEEVILKIKTGDTVIADRLRISIVMENFNGSWKLIHAHGSKPVESEEDPWHVKEWEAEKKRLEEKVNEQTADLKHKNRELEIEAASERVRSVAMGMQKPDEIMNVLNVIRQELESFELGNIGTWIWIFNDDHTLTQWDISELGPDGSLANVNITIDLKKSASSDLHAANWSDTDYYTMLWQGQSLKILIDEIKELDPESGENFQALVNSGEMEVYWQACAPFSRGVLGLDYSFDPPAEADRVLTKMASAIDMAYQRFEDLQEAQKRALESKIETALEKVRSRSLAMHHSSELQDVIRTVHQQFKNLEVDISGGAFIVVNENLKNGFRCWGAGGAGNYIQEVPIPFIDRPIYKVLADGIREGKSFITEYYSKEEKQEFFRHLFNHSPFNQTPVSRQKDLLSTEGGYTRSCAVFDHISIFIINHHGRKFNEVENSILRQMGRVFEQAYTRFLDLERAEAQAYESKVEASLERVRGMASAMNHSDDLMQIAEAMFKEMEILKINPLRYGLGMIDSKTKEAELWASTVNDGHYLDMLGTISLTWHPMLRKVLDAWDAQHEEMIYELKGEERSDYYKKIGRINPEIPNLEALQDPASDISEFVSFFPFKSGALYAFTKGEPGEDGRSILKRFSSVFEQAHIRYNDLQTAEKQARQIREERDRLADTLKELRATQEQLVQREKLASLGQLTAGIAHEIKNPLNFVNNFSELSVELVEEARDEIRRETEDGGPKNSPFAPASRDLGEGSGDPESFREKRGVSDEAENEDLPQNSESVSSSANTPLNPLSRGDGIAEGDGRGVSDGGQNPSLLLDILDDIETNLKTIHKHGTRADGIVKSMLQHSRGGDGTMEPTPLNPLIKEYVNLAFHGMRAGKDPINVDIDLQLDESVGEVPIIAEDFSRVVLNLVNNAFDAMREKLAVDSGQLTKSPFPKGIPSGEGGTDHESFRGKVGDDNALIYQPKLTVRTKSNSGRVTIEIEDNGPGIPEEIKDKILQPFFTTKKGTQGTGLGLSITNDIIKAHGGSIGISSSEGATIFSIILPDN